MPLLGTGVLAIWNGIAPESEAAFVAWHVREHIPERVGVPGFLRGRRYVAVQGDPKYFNFYETESPETLASDAYIARLNAPTPWTREVVAAFRDTSRTVCDVISSRGRGEGAAIETIQLQASDPDSFAHRAGDVLARVLEAPGIVAAHALRGRTDDPSSRTEEKSLQSKPDQTADWIVLIEAIDAASLLAARSGPAADDVFTQAGADGLRRGLYQLQFALTKHAKETLP